jgi:acetyl-CoA carboxylase biotin carboxyl carrier protein
MDEKTLLALFDRFDKSSAVELKFSGNGNTFELRRKEAFTVCAPAASVPSAAITVSSHEPPHTASNAPHVPVASASAGESRDGGAAAGNEYVKSPIVGTFYRAASPDTPPFAEIGKKIAKGQKICIIEAMKMMNALESEIDCEIVKILVNNGDMVEFDQPLFEVRKL